MSAEQIKDRTTMNEQPTILSDLFAVLYDEDLIRLAHRLRRKGKYLSSFALDHELALREARATAIDTLPNHPLERPQIDPGASLPPL